MNVQWPIGPMPAAQWHAEFQAKNGRAATDAEYQAAAQIGHISDAQQAPAAQAAPAQPQAAQTQQGQSTEGLAQAAAGAQQLAAGAAQFAQGATKNAQNIITKRMAENKLGAIAHLSALGAALLTIIASFMPAVTVSSAIGSVSAGWYIQGGDGPIIMFMSLVTLGMGIAYLFVEKAWARYTFAAVSAVAALVVLIDTFNMIGKSNSYSNSYVTVSVGFGVYLMLIMSLVLIAAAVLVTLDDIKQLIAKAQANSSQNAAAQPAQQYQQAPQADYQAAPQQAPAQQAPAAPAQPEQPGQQPNA